MIWQAQRKPKCAAFAELGGHSHTAAEAMNRFLYNRKPDAGAFVHFIWIHASEDLEDSFEVLWRDADAVVGDRDFNYIIFDRRGN